MVILIVFQLNPEAVIVLQQIYSILLRLLPRARHYVGKSKPLDFSWMDKLIFFE